MKTKDEYTIKKFPLYRRLSIDSCRLSKKRNYIHGLIEVDITKAYNYLRELKKNKAMKISLTAWIIKKVSDAISEDLSVQAMKQRNKLVVYKDIDILLAVETIISGQSFPIVHVLRKVQEKSAYEISNEIKELKNESLNKEKLEQWKKARLLVLLPWFIRKFLYALILSSPRRRKSWMGTTAVTAVGMFGSGAGWGINLPNHTIAFTLGGISERPTMEDDQLKIHRFINITIHIDHDIVDGAPAARFSSRLTKELQQTPIP